MNTILVGAAVLAVVALLEGLYYLVKFLGERQKEEMQRRLQAVTTGAGAESSFSTLRRVGRLAENPFWGQLLGGVPLLERMETLMEQAQVGGTVAAQLVFSVLMGLAGAVAGLALGRPVLALMLFAGGASIPTVRLLLARSSRSRQISEQFPSALDMMARSLRAGHSLTSAFKLVASEMPGPINLEFARAYEEQNLGVSFYRAVQQILTRVPNNPDLQIFAASGNFVADILSSGKVCNPNNFEVAPAKIQEGNDFNDKVIDALRGVDKKGDPIAEATCYIGKTMSWAVTADGCPGNPIFHGVQDVVGFVKAKIVEVTDQKGTAYGCPGETVPAVVPADGKAGRSIVVEITCGAGADPTDIGGGRAYNASDVRTRLVQ